MSYDNGRWYLKKTYAYAYQDYSITVPENIQFDLASVPRFLWWFIAPLELSIVAPLIHDFLYRYKGQLPDPNPSHKTYTRKEADVIFFHIMNQESIGLQRSIPAYIAVRVFGGLANWSLI